VPLPKSWNTEEENRSRARLRAEVLGLRVEASFLRFVRLHRKYSPTQPRIPAGSPGCGQWTDGGGSIGDGRVRVAQNGPPRAPRSPTTSLTGRPLQGTPGQMSELAAMDAQATAAIAEVREIDRHWRPPESMAETIEGEIVAARFRHETAQARLKELGAPRVREELLGICIRPNGIWIGEQIDTYKETTRTVSRDQFRELAGRLMTGAWPQSSRSGYRGQEFKRSDGTVFGLRWSIENDMTIDILESHDLFIRNGTKVHFK